jgi:hypothetical protein
VSGCSGCPWRTRRRLDDRRLHNRAPGDRGKEQADAGASAEGAQVSTTPVSGVGDQALYISASYSAGTLTGYFYGLDTVYGSLYISCFNTTVGSPPTAPQQGALTQVCRQVLNRL